MSDTKSSDVFIFTAQDLDEANALRTELLKTRHLWLFVMKSRDGYDITCNNSRGGRISEGLTVFLRDSAQRFIDEYRGIVEVEVTVDEDTYYEKLGEEIEKHPLGSAGVRRV